MKQDGMKKFNKIFPLYAGLSSDLLFWVAIDTLFLTIVKKFSAAQIVSLTTVSLIACILFQVPLLKIIKKIGNTKSVRLGSLSLLISSILLTFGQNEELKLKLLESQKILDENETLKEMLNIKTSYQHFKIALGKIIYEIAFTLQNMANAILKNNLELQNKNNEYIKIKTKSNTIYATVTMIISFIASLMFNFNNYLPMLCSIVFCLICFILSFYIIDFSSYDKIKIEEIKPKTSKKIRYNRLIILLIISYGLFYPIVNSGQTNGKLFIQQELLLNFNVEKTALIIGFILSISRIVRVISNIAFNKIHNKYKEKVGVILPILLCASTIFMILGYFIRNSIILKFSIMSFGYIIILFIRDPFKVYIQDLALRNVGKEGQQSLLTTMELSRKIVRAIMSLGFTMILVNNPMIIVVTILFVLSIIEIIISIRLYKSVLRYKVHR